MSGTAWKVNDLRGYVRRKPAAERKSLLDVIGSMDHSHRIFHYHFFTARDALKHHLDHDDPTGFKNIEVVLGGADRAEVNLAYTVSEANLIACMHTLRGSVEIFAQLVNMLQLKSKFSVDDCTVGKVLRTLPASDLKTALQELLAMEWFQYLAAFINTTKHRQLVGHSVTVSFEENRAGVRVGKFEYDGKAYSAHWAHDLLRGLADVKNALVRCGRELNRACGV